MFQTSMPKIGVPPQPIFGIRGLSWFADEQTSKTPSFLAHSHAQPEPNLDAAALENISLKESKEWLPPSMMQNYNHYKNQECTQME